MAWLQLSLESNKKDAELLTELLEQFGAISVSLSAISNELLFGQQENDNQQLWERTCITALLHDDIDLDTLLVTLNRRVGNDHILGHKIELLPDKDWVSDFQNSHGIRLFSDKLCICPGWCAPPDNVSTVLMLDPGLAFGTGSHDTTSMCLEWLTENDISGKSVIDYGCGSGILALAALKLGASTAYAIDIDPQALIAARENAEKNRLSDRITISLPGDINLQKTDFLLANVLLNPLKDLASLFANLVQPGGKIILSGILATQAEECQKVYQSWFDITPPVFRNEWAMLEGVRRQGQPE